VWSWEDNRSVAVFLQGEKEEERGRRKGKRKRKR
jgi:hypothetical protein